LAVIAGGSDERWVLRGTLTVSRRRCGKPNCRCVSGELHESPALRFSEGGRYRTVTLREADVADVAAGVARYERARAELDAVADAGLAELRARLAGRRSGGRR
jgi:hypothetical protein